MNNNNNNDNNDTLISTTVDIKSFIGDFSKAPDQVLKFIIHMLYNENQKITKELEEQINENDLLVEALEQYNANEQEEEQQEEEQQEQL